jgi:hypothetical protein
MKRRQRRPFEALGQLAVDETQMALEMARGLEKAANDASGKRLTEARARDLVL